MSVHGSIFLDFNLPNAATWFYFSLLLAIALFFRFTRLLSIRNLDVLALFLLVPGLLLIQEAQGQGGGQEQTPAVSAARTVQATASLAVGPQLGASSATALVPATAPLPAPRPRLLWYGYLWLLCGSAYFLVRCLLDLALVRRPALSPNLNLAGLAWLAGALFVCLVAVAVRRPDGPAGSVGKRSAAVDETQRRAEDLVKQEIGQTRLGGAEASFWVERVLAMVCHGLIVAGLIWIGCRHFQDATAGMAAATFYLLLPYTAFHVEQVHHVWPTALLVWAVFAYRKPAVSGLLLGIAAGTVYFSALLYPVWLSFYWRRGAGRFTVSFLLGGGVCLALLAAVLWSDGELAGRLHSALSLSDWQAWRAPSPETKGFWTGIQYAWVYRLPVFIAFVAFLCSTVLWPSPKNLAHLLALSAAVLIGIQFWYADQGGVYILWYLPLLLLLAFRPNLADREAPAIAAETDWLCRLRRALTRSLSRLFRLPEPAVPAS